MKSFRFLLLLGVSVLLLTACVGTSKLTSDSNIDPYFDFPLKSVMIVGVGNKDFVKLYNAISDSLQMEMREFGVEKVEYYTIEHGDRHDIDRLNARLNQMNPEAILLMTQYYQYKGDLRLMAMDVSLELSPDRTVVWKGYVDVEMSGTHKIEQNYHKLRRELVQLFKSDEVFSK